jgi:hypothetical protein
VNLDLDHPTCPFGLDRLQLSPEHCIQRDVAMLAENEVHFLRWFRCVDVLVGGVVEVGIQKVILLLKF